MQSHKGKSVHGDPQENEERLLQLGWNHLFSKSDSELESFLPKLLKAVHLPLASEQFLCDLLGKVENYEEAKILVEKAKLIKSTLTEEGAVQSESECEENRKWCTDRAWKSGNIVIVRKNFGKLKDSVINFVSEHITIKDKVWQLRLTSFSSKLSEQKPYLYAYVECVSNIDAESPGCKYQFEIIPPGNLSKSHCFKCCPLTFGEQSIQLEIGKVFDRSMGLRQVNCAPSPAQEN